MAANYQLRKEITGNSPGVSIITEGASRLAPGDYELDTTNKDGLYLVRVVLGRSNSSLGYFNGTSTNKHMPFSPSENSIQLAFKNRTDFQSYFSSK